MTTIFKPGDRLDVSLGDVWTTDGSRLFIGHSSCGKVVYERKDGRIDYLPAEDVMKHLTPRSQVGVKKRDGDIVSLYSSLEEAQRVISQQKYPQEWHIVDVSWKE